MLTQIQKSEDIVTIKLIVNPEQKKLLYSYIASCSLRFKPIAFVVCTPIKGDYYPS
jgi:hypothetical protein